MLSGERDGGRAVGDHQVAVFAFELRQGAQAVVFGFQGEADDPAAALSRAERGDDVVGFDEVQLERLAGLGDLVRLDADRAVVAGGGGADQAVAAVELARRGGEHFFGRNDRHDAGAGGILDLDRPAHDDDFMAQREGRLGQRLAHPTAGGVREIAHRVEVLPRGTGGDEDSGHAITGDMLAGVQTAFSCQTTNSAFFCHRYSVSVNGSHFFVEQSFNRGLDIGRLGHAAHAGAAAALPAFLRVDEVDAVAAERGDVALDGGLLPTSRCSSPGRQRAGRRS